MASLTEKMATESETTEDKPVKKAEPKKAEPKVEEPKVEEPKFSHQRLIQECASVVGYPSHVIAGALVGVTKKELTISETAAACEKWLKAQVR